MFLARHPYGSDTVWLHKIENTEFLLRRGSDSVFSVKRTPFAWDWDGVVEAGVSAVGETEGHALQLLQEREKIIAELNI